MQPQNFWNQDELYTATHLSITVAPSDFQFIAFHIVFYNNLNIEV